MVEAHEDPEVFRLRLGALIPTRAPTSPLTGRGRQGARL